MTASDAGDPWAWFDEARYGMFIHWGPYAVLARGEQPLFRERIDQRAYAEMACAWCPEHFDARVWAEVAVRGGMKYAVLTTRHHDGFCLWDSKVTDYSSARQAAGRDFVAEYADAFGAAGLKVGLYYSLADWRLPAYWEGPEHDPAGFAGLREYVHAQLRELLGGYGEIAELWFDGAWPEFAEDWGGEALLDELRALQPGILINNRLGRTRRVLEDGYGGPERPYGDFGTPEHRIVAEGRRWESCQTATWRLWGYAAGERWRPADVLLDMLVECASRGGNLLLNVGPRADGRLPAPFVERTERIGDWLAVHGEAIYGSEGGEVCEFVTHGRQVRKGRDLYLVCRFWDGSGAIRLAGLATPVESATLLTTGQEVAFEQGDGELVLGGLPAERPTALFPVIRLRCAACPQACDWARDRLWCGDPRRMTPWAAGRGSSVWADGRPR